MKNKYEKSKKCLYDKNLLGFGHWCASCILQDKCDIFKEVTKKHKKLL